jgi:hypothetical protein
MQLDNQNMFSEGTLATGTSNSDVIDMLAATDLGTLGIGRGHGGEGAEVFVNVPVKGNADNTLAYNLVAADDVGFTANKITVAALAATNIAAGTGNHLRVGHHAARRFFRLEYTVAGTTASLGTAGQPFKAFLHTTANQRPLAGGPGVF